MQRPRIAARRVVPYMVGGASGIHILARLWRSTRLPARSIPLHVFLLKHTDVILVVFGSPIVIQHFVTEQGQRSPRDSESQAQSLTPVLSEIVHQLRQVFSALLLGLGLIKRKATDGKTTDVRRLAERLKSVVAEGVRAVNELDPPDTANGRELSSEV
jgi:hypothetical protein